MSSDDDERKSRIITLTGAPPVRILEDAWPEVATLKVYLGRDSATPAILAPGPIVIDMPPGPATKPGGRSTISMRVRYHADDDRVLVYGTREIVGVPPERYGEISDRRADVGSCIERVARSLTAREPDSGLCARLVSGLLGRLPAVDL